MHARQLAWVIVPGVLALAIGLGLTWQATSTPVAASWPDMPSPVRATGAITMDKFVYLPLIYAATSAPTCQTIQSETYGTLGNIAGPTDRPAEQHADLNLGLRGYVLNPSSQLALIDYGGPTDSGAPQFPSLFGDNRKPAFTSGYKVYNWNFDPACNCRTTPINNPDTTLLGMGTSLNEIIKVPTSGYGIGDGYEVLVLYADVSRITLKYTREDNVVYGYTIHMENVCTEPRLLQLYRDSNASGRGQLPALRAGQGFGRAMGTEILGSIQDSGAWMDPRSRKDWWQGR